MQKLFFVLLFIYQVHITEESEVPDHCLGYALSDSDNSFSNTCNHQHEMVCSSCEILKRALNTIENAVAECSTSYSPEQWNDLKFRCTKAIEAVLAWKAHEVRLMQQDKPRHHIIDNLTSSDVMITEDWAMKFLPQKFRETQSDWFGKRGISWHISVVMYKSKNGDIQQQSFVHIVDNCNQDTNTVITLMEHILRTLHAENPDITTAYYRHDNAGCYHSVPLLIGFHLMEKATGIKVV